MVALVHKGHRELFKAALERAEKVAIGVRATQSTDGKNPFSFEEVKKFIDDDLGHLNINGKQEICMSIYQMLPM